MNLPQNNSRKGPSLATSLVFLSCLLACVPNGVKGFMNSVHPRSPGMAPLNHQAALDYSTTLLHSSSPHNKNRASDRYSSTTMAQSNVAHQVSELYAEGQAYQKTIKRNKKTREQIEKEEMEKQKREEVTTIPINKMLNELNRYPALILNADYQPMSYLPLSVSHWQEAIKLIFSGKVAVVDVYDGVTIRAASLEIPLPSVVALNEYVPQCSHKPAFTRRNVFLRDEFTCQYCKHPFHTKELSIDHVLPRSMGGRLNWENAVTSCLRCNGRKGNMLVSDLKSVGMKLHTKPRAPTRHELAMKAGKMLPRKVHPTWKPFLGSAWNDDDDDDDDTITPKPDLEALGINLHDGEVAADLQDKPRKKMSKNKKKRIKKQLQKKDDMASVESRQ